MYVSFVKKEKKVKVLYISLSPVTRDFREFRDLRWNEKLKKNHTCEEGGTNLRNSVKPDELKKQLLLKNNIIKKNAWMYHYFTPVYQKSWWYDQQFLRYLFWQTEIGNYGSLFAL